MQENITGIRIIQSLSREKINSEHFEKVNKDNLDANIQAAQVLRGDDAGGGSAGIHRHGADHDIRRDDVLHGALLVGTLVAFNLYIQQFFDPIRALTMEYTQLQRAMASAARIFELVDVKQEITDKPERRCPARTSG